MKVNRYSANQTDFLNIYLTCFIAYFSGHVENQYFNLICLDYFNVYSAL